MWQGFGTLKMVMATIAKASAERCFHHVGAAHCVRSKFQFGSNCFLPKSLKHWVRSGSHLHPHILVAQRGISTTQQHASLKDAQMPESSSTFDGKDLFDLNLEDTGAIFKAKGTSDLAFALFILKLCMQRYTHEIYNWQKRSNLDSAPPHWANITLSQAAG